MLLATLLGAGTSTKLNPILNPNLDPNTKCLTSPGLATYTHGVQVLRSGVLFALQIQTSTCNKLLVNFGVHFGRILFPKSTSEALWRQKGDLRLLAHLLNKIKVFGLGGRSGPAKFASKIAFEIR